MLARVDHHHFRATFELFREFGEFRNTRNARPAPRCPKINNHGLWPRARERPLTRFTDTRKHEFRRRISRFQRLDVAVFLGRLRGARTAVDQRSESVDLLSTREIGHEHRFGGCGGGDAACRGRLEDQFRALFNHRTALQRASHRFDELRFGIVEDAQFLGVVIGDEYEHVIDLAINFVLLDARRNDVRNRGHQLHRNFGWIVLTKREREFDKRQRLKRVEQLVVRRTVVADLEVREWVGVVHRNDLAVRDAEVISAKRNLRAAIGAQDKLRLDDGAVSL